MKRAALLVLALGLLGIAGSGARAGDRSRKPNVVLILADDLGYGDLGCYGQQKIRTPNLDRMAREGMRFTQFYSGAPVCAPSRCVLMTGLHNGHAYIRGNAKTDLRPEDFTAAELFKQAGYTTGLMGKWGLGHERSTGPPNLQGFDQFYGYLDQTHAHNSYPSFLVRNETRVPLKNVVPDEGPVGQGKASVKAEFSQDLITDAALQFLEQSKDRPFFLYYTPTLPHTNNEARELEVPDFGEYVDKDWPNPQKAYAAMITRLDRDVGRLLERLKQLGLDERTLVLFTSDNGPHREGGFDPEFSDSNGPLRGIKRAMYEGGIRVPMIARWPGKISAGTVSEHVGYFPDFLPTAAELTGERAPAGDGRSFLPALLGKPGQTPHPFLYWEFYEQGGSQGVRMGDWKAVSKPWGSAVELYNLREDLGETRNLAAEHPEIARQAQEIMRKEHVPSPLWKVR